MRYLLACLGLLLALFLSTARAVEVYFWGTDKSPPAGVTIDGHPCGGSVVILDVKRIPPDSIWLKADHMREVDASGKTLRTWRVPADHYPVGLEDDVVVLAFGSEPEFTLRISTSGAITKGPAPKATALQPHACPASVRKEYSCVVTLRKPVTFMVYAPICS
jgi:hypothetical protein